MRPTITATGMAITQIFPTHLDDDLKRLVDSYVSGRVFGDPPTKLNVPCGGCGAYAGVPCLNLSHASGHGTSNREYAARNAHEYLENDPTQTQIMMEILLARAVVQQWDMTLSTDTRDLHVPCPDPFCEAAVHDPCREAGEGVGFNREEVTRVVPHALRAEAAAKYRQTIEAFARKPTLWEYGGSRLKPFGGTLPTWVTATPGSGTFASGGSIYSTSMGSPITYSSHTSASTSISVSLSDPDSELAVKFFGRSPR